jgi:hypothetical protein
MPPSEDPRKRDMVGKYYIALFRNGRPLMIGPILPERNDSEQRLRDIAENIAMNTRRMQPVQLKAA